MADESRTTDTVIELKEVELPSSATSDEVPSYVRTFVNVACYISGRCQE